MSAPAPVFETIVKLRNRFEIAERTMAFQFEKPAGWTFQAGQFLDMTLLYPPERDIEGAARSFSIASAPQEPDLLVATRLRDTAFKRVLETMPLGTQVKIEGPFGNLTLHSNATRPAVILTGGIGITPFRSMVVRAVQERLGHHIFLFYSNRRPEDAAFLEELQGLEHRDPNYRLIPTMTDMSKSHQPWHGETGRIGKEMLEKYLSDVEAAIYYMAGSPGMVRALHALLNATGVQDGDIRTEEFSGY